MTCAADGLCQQMANENAELQRRLARSEQVLNGTRERLERCEELLESARGQCEKLRSRALEADKIVPRRPSVSIAELQRAIHKNAVDHGWWAQAQTSYIGAFDLREVAIKLALVVTEVSEAIEDVRTCSIASGDTTEDGKPVGLPTELADIMIRVLDLSGYLGIDIEHEILRKHEYNKTRSYRHGGKVL